jgi:hypothetical protein
MEQSLILHSVSVIIVLWAIILLSYILGLPITWKLLEVNEKNYERPYLFFYISIITGYTVLNLAVFFATLIFSCGTDSVAIPTLIFILLLSLGFIYYKRQILFEVITHEYLKKLLLVALVPIASFHVILPILTGKWDMAYSTGDDASRWFMVVDYFRHNVFEYWKNTDSTLIWRLGERPLQNVSGAIICSIFNTNQAFGYSLSSASASIMSCFSFCFLVEAMFPFNNKNSRYLLWAIAIAFFGFFGIMSNVFYTGRTTHHFSIYPVLASLGFIAVKNKFVNRLIWFTFWNVALAYYYSIRFSLNYMMIVFVVIGFLWIFRQNNFKDLLKNAAAYIISLGVAVSLAWGEVKSILDSILNEGVGFFLMQRGAGYGSDGTVFDRFMKWGGFISTYELAESIPTLIFYFKMALIIFGIVAAVYMSIKSAKKSPAYLALLVLTIAMAINLFLSENYYVAWKSALYWPIYILIGVVALAIQLFESENEKKRKIGIGIAVYVFLFIILTVRQLNYFYILTDQRYTKVDKTSYEMVKVLSEYKETQYKQKSQIKIFGFDYSSERHLLLREIFKDFDWQPVRDKSLNYIHDIVIKDPDAMDDYRYDYLLYANTYGDGEWIDISGNKNSLIYEHAPFMIFSSKSSLVEFKYGIDIVYNRNTDTGKLDYEGQLTADTSSVVFANNGYHKWLNLSFRVGNNDEIDLKKDLQIIMTDGSKKSTYNNFVYDKKNKKYVITIDGLNNTRIADLLLIRKNMKLDVFISKIKWGY